MRLYAALRTLGGGSDLTSGSEDTMASVAQAVRKPVGVAGILWAVAILLVLYLVSTHGAWIAQLWAAWWSGVKDLPVTVPACPHPQCGRWFPH